MAYVVRVNEKFVAPEGLASRRSRATRFDSIDGATEAGCAATCGPYSGHEERLVVWAAAKAEGRFEVLDSLTLRTVSI